MEQNLAPVPTGDLVFFCNQLGVSGCLPKLRKIYPAIQKDLSFACDIFNMQFEAGLNVADGIGNLSPASGGHDVCISLSSDQIQIVSTHTSSVWLMLENWTLCAPLFIPVAGRACVPGRDGSVEEESFFWACDDKDRYSCSSNVIANTIGAYGTFERLHSRYSDAYPKYANFIAKSAGARDSLRFGITLPAGVAAIFGTSFTDQNPVKQWDTKDVFLDIGSGTGSVVSQVAYTIGIPSIGIECTEAFVTLGRNVDQMYRADGLKSVFPPATYHGDASSAAFETLYRAANIFYMTNTNFDTTPQIRGRVTSSLKLDGYEFFSVEHAILYRLAICLKRKRNDVKKRSHFLITTLPLGDAKRHTVANRQQLVQSKPGFLLSFCVPGVIAQLHSTTDGVAVNWNTSRESSWVYSLKVE